MASLFDAETCHFVYAEVARGKYLDRLAVTYALARVPGPRWWPWWPLCESDKKLRSRLKELICQPNSKP